MTNPLDTNLSAFTEIAIRALSERTDPLITRVNEGGVLTNTECRQVFADLYKLTNIMKASALAMEESMKEIKAQDTEIALMKVLLGVAPSETSGK